MSQYGARGAALAGLSAEKILKHYYRGAVIATSPGRTCASASPSPAPSVTVGGHEVGVVAMALGEGAPGEALAQRRLPRDRARRRRAGDRRDRARAAGRDRQRPDHADQRRRDRDAQRAALPRRAAPGAGGRPAPRRGEHRRHRGVPPRGAARARSRPSGATTRRRRSTPRRSRPARTRWRRATPRATSTSMPTSAARSTAASRTRTRARRWPWSATRGKVLTYGGEIIQAFFFSTSGGRTENVENVFGGEAAAVPALGARPLGPDLPVPRALAGPAHGERRPPGPAARARPAGAELRGHAPRRLAAGDHRRGRSRPTASPTA